MKRTQKFTIDGQTYSSLEEMPASARKKWETVSALLPKVAADLLGKPVKKTTIEFEERIEYGPSEFVPGTGQADGEALNEIFARMRANTRARADAGIQQSPEESAGSAKPTGAEKIIGLFLVGLLFAVIGLAMFGLLTQVRITMTYSAAWWAAATMVGLGLTAGLVRGWNRRQVPTAADPEPKRMGIGRLLGTALGITCMSLEGILGGLPALAHHLTSRAGEAVVTVSGKESTYRRGSCSPRLIISEFTYGLRDYLCPSDKAFAQIAVGEKIRVKGTVSAFGIEPLYLYISASQK